MVLSIGISNKGIFNRDTLILAVWIASFVTLTEFLLEFFGLNFILDLVPIGFRLLVVVFLSVIISRKVIIKFRGREVL